MRSKIENGNVHMHILDNGAISILKKYIGIDLDLDLDQETRDLFLSLDMNKQLDRDIAFTFAIGIAVEDPRLAHEIIALVTLKEDFDRRNRNGE